MKITVYDQEGKETGTALLPKEVFDVKLNPDLVHQVVVSQIANRRKVIANTKNRGEVRGGGKKPWRQKGTGRARAGSIRSPLWRHGGISFGPTKEKIFKKKINKKMRRLALFMTLSAKAKNNLLLILDKFNLEQPKTKLLAKIIENWKLKILRQAQGGEQGRTIENFKNGSFLIVLPKYEKNIVLAARNLPKIETDEARNLNALDVLSFKYLIMPKETIKIIKDTFLK